MKGCVFWGWGIQIRISESKNGSRIFKIYTLGGFLGSNPNENWISNLISLERKDYVKYLGVLTDSNLSWKYHISHVESKISSNVGVIARLKWILVFCMITSDEQISPPSLVCKENSLHLDSLCVYCLGNSFMPNVATLQFQNEAWWWNLLIWRKHA